MFEPVNLTTLPPHYLATLIIFWHDAVYILGPQYNNLTHVHSILHVLSPLFWMFSPTTPSSPMTYSPIIMVHFMLSPHFMTYIFKLKVSQMDQDN